jgi:hypothetical protein
MLFWWRRGTKDFAEAIRPELKSLSTPEPRKELLARILASRESGTRIILPEVPSEPAHPRRKYLIGGAIAAALLLAVVPRERSTNGSADDTWASPSFLGNPVFAQTTSSSSKVPAATLERASTLRPISLEFARRMYNSKGGLTKEHRRSVTLVPAVVNGAPAWRITSLERDAATQRYTNSDTIYVARSNLRMLLRAVHMSPYHRFQRINVQQRFVGDSITGRMTTDGPSIGAGRVIARRLDPAFRPYLSDAFASIFLMAAPLHRNWRGSASLLGWAVVPNDVFVPITMRVEGEEPITVPAGKFDCWRIGIKIGDKHISYWARKSDGVGVRVLNDSQADTEGTREVVLLTVR